MVSVKPHVRRVCAGKAVGDFVASDIVSILNVVYNVVTNYSVVITDF